jgi:hypothetical protein
VGDDAEAELGHLLLTCSIYHERIRLPTQVLIGVCACPRDELVQADQDILVVDKIIAITDVNGWKDCYSRLFRTTLSSQFHSPFYIYIQSKSKKNSNFIILQRDLNNK